MEIGKIRQAFLLEGFAESVGRRAFLVTHAFPFLLIGQIDDVQGDFLFVAVETAYIAELDGTVMRIHVDDIAVFFIEDGVHEVPALTS